MALRFASWEENGNIVHGLIEKPCDSSCPCEKAHEKGVENPAALSLADLSPNCALQQIPRMIDRKIRYELDRDLNLFSSPEFESHCRKERKFHLDAASESVRYLANPCNTFSRKKLVHKLWNEQAARLYAEYITANAIDVNAIIPPSATAPKPKLKTLSDTLRGGFTVERLTALIAYLVPDLDKLRNLPKEKQQGRGRNGEWKSAFPAAAAAIEARGYLLDTVSDRILASLFHKHFKVSISDKTFAKRRLSDEKPANKDYLAKANSWLDKEMP